MGPKPRILVVDDEPAVLLTYTLILEQNGYAVEAVQSVQEAKAALESKHFELVVCDLSLRTNSAHRGYGGLEVIEYARKQQPKIGTVLLTGFADKETTEEAARRGVALLFKPIDVQELLSTLRLLAGGSAA